jgi:hypothetical protein
MPIIIKGESYNLPTENDTPGPTGREIIAIEDAFGLDGLTLLGVLSDDKLHNNPAYSKLKALYALAWICMTRAGKIVSIDDVLNNYAINDISVESDSDPKKSPTAEG